MFMINAVEMSAYFLKLLCSKELPVSMSSVERAGPLQRLQPFYDPRAVYLNVFRGKDWTLTLLTTLFHDPEAARWLARTFRKSMPSAPSGMATPKKAS